MTSTESKGLVLIGLDGATWKLLRKWIAAGELPNLEKLCSEGVTGTLLSTVPSTTCPALPALFTGKNPANIGIFGFVDSSGNPVLLENVPGPRIWDVLGKNGIASCIIDVRFTYRPARLNGVMTCSTPLPPNAEELYYPPDLDKMLGRRVPLATDYHGKVYRPGDFDERKEKVLGHLRDYLEERYRLIRDLTSKRDYGLVFTWFGDVDWMQHLYWHDEDAILQHLRTVDRYIGKFAADFEGRDIIIISDHGFHKHPETKFFVNAWLMRNGFLTARGNALTRWLYGRGILIYRVFLRNKRVRAWMRSRNGPAGKGTEEKAVLKDTQRGNFPAVDWKKTKAYFFNSWGIGIIRENLDEDYEDFRERLIGKMGDLADTRGARVFARVWKKEDIFSGKYLDQVPDIIYQLDGDLFPDPLVISTRLYREHIGGESYRITGMHENDREGIIIAHGPSLAQGSDIGEARLEDIAPTLYHLLGCAIPDDLDGRIIDKLLSAEMRCQESRYYTPQSDEEDWGKRDLSRDDEESIKRQLKDMGYLSD